MSNSRKLYRRPANHIEMDWRVAIIVDDDHCGVNPSCRHEPAPHAADIDSAEARFAYTIGLHERYRLAELWCSAISDSVPHHRLPAELLRDLLNTLAIALVQGDAGPGSSLDFSGSVHGQPVTYTFSLAEPGPREPFQAFQTDPRATVIPVAWTVEEMAN